jgi:2-desacetyl-2-hydroxyethyl bacteriochlorophyllide A dehydrogenase
MKAIQLKQPRVFQRIDIPEPGRPSPGEALVRVHRVGICGTDLAGYLGKMPFYSYPRIPGHELGVEVLAVGAEVTNVRPGDRCSVEPYINCGECFACRRGAGNCCMHLQVLGVHTDGGLRPQFLVPARKLHPSANLTLEQLALIETLAIGCHAVNRGDPKQGEWTLLIGAGPIGLATLEFIRLTGAPTIVLDTNAARLEFCRKTYDIEHTVLSKGDGSEVKTVEEITGGNFATVVFDATGSPQSMSNAFNYVAHTGKLVFVGIVDSDVTFFDPLLHRREMTVYASRNALPGDFTRIIRLIEDGQIDTRPWITHRTPFERLIEDFPSFTRPETGVVKAIVEVGE